MPCLHRDFDKVNLPINWQIFAYDELASTNVTAHEFVNKGFDEGTIIIADKQTAGKGRESRKWESPKGNLFVSFLIDVTTKYRDCGQLSFVVSLALSNVISSLSKDIFIKLKWPNDVLLNDKKVSGILLETQSYKDKNFVIAGVGVNLTHIPEIKALYFPTSLKDENIDISREEFIEKFANELSELIKEWKNNGFGFIKEEWLKKAKGIKQNITINLFGNSKQGVFVGVDENGSLILEQQEGQTIKITAGDVFFGNKESNNNNE